MRTIVASVLVLSMILAAAADSFEERITTCLGCHGEEGQSETPEVPSLGGQPVDYLLIQLYVFREKMRPVEIMNEQTQDLSDEDLKRFAATIAKLPAPQPPAAAADQTRMDRGKVLVSQHRCNSCHAPNLAGQDQVARLAAQREDYLLMSLRAYKSNARPGYDAAMASVVQPLTDEDLSTLAYYIARVK